MTRAIVLCAGRGERLRPLTDHTPKPLIEVGGETLLGRHLKRLASSGIREAVVNAAHLANQIVDYVGDGREFGLKATVVVEGTQALETGGGMLNALPHLGDEPFIAVNGDIWTDFDFASLPQTPAGLAHLVLVTNPEHHPDGDFGLKKPFVVNQPRQLTFSGIGVYRPELVANSTPGKFSITPLLRAAADREQVTGQHFAGPWFDSGTAQRLTAIRQYLG